jgi:hypothetical protein
MYFRTPFEDKRFVMDLKDELIKLGSEQPRLQKHIRPVLDKIKEAAQEYDIRLNRIEDYELQDVTIHKAGTQDKAPQEVYDLWDKVEKILYSPKLGPNDQIHLFRDALKSLGYYEDSMYRVSKDDLKDLPNEAKRFMENETNLLKDADDFNKGDTFYNLTHFKRVAEPGMVMGNGKGTKYVVTDFELSTPVGTKLTGSEPKKITRQNKVEFRGTRWRDLMASGKYRYMGEMDLDKVVRE